MSEELKRKDIDNPWKRNCYKNRKFNGKRSVTDEYTGKTVYYSKNGADVARGEGRHYSTATTSNVDHIITIDEMKKRYSGTLTKKQLKELANADYNLALTNERLNKAKKNMSNHEYLIKQFKNGNPENLQTSVNMLGKELKSETLTCAKSTAMKSNNLINDVGGKLKINKDITNKIGNTVQRGTEAAMISLMVSSVNNLVAVGHGDKDVKQALKDIALDAGGTLSTSVAIDAVQNTVAKVAEVTGTNIPNLLAKDLPIAEISAVVMVGISVAKWANGEISGEQCVCEVLTNGLGTLAYAVGNCFGGPIAGAIASMITTAVVGKVCNVVLDCINEGKYNRERIKMFNKVADEAIIEIEKQRRILKQIVETEFQRWDSAFDSGFELIYSSLFEGDADGISQGLTTILSVINPKVELYTSNNFRKEFRSAPELIITV